MCADGSVKLADFGLSCQAAEAAADVVDKQQVMSRGRPTGGFHKRSMVGAAGSPAELSCGARRAVGTCLPR
jgi:hypothetical protein